MRRVFDFLRLDDLPLLTRPNYVAERRQITLWGIVAGTVEGNMVSVVAAKTFETAEVLTTLIWALPILMNVLNVAWGAFLRGKPRKQAFILIASCGLIVIASVGLTSADWRPWGGWLFAAQIAGTHLFLSGLITLRTTIWKVNYPGTHRARIAGRLQTVRMFMALLTTYSLSSLYDWDPSCYRWIYPTAAAIGACSLLPLRRMRMRGEAAELRRLREQAANPTDQPGKPRLGILNGLREAATILRKDVVFARYMTAQFLLGSANFLTDPILVVAFSRDLDFSYKQSLGLLFLLPHAVLLISIQFWAPFFDRVGVLRFRIYNSACWTFSYAGAAAAMIVIQVGGHDALPIALPLLIIGRIFNGLGRGGGAIAWTLGHLHFAPAHQTELYMGIHVGLTGLRGLFMPMIGVGATLLLGYWALAIPVGLAITAHYLFRRLAQEHGQANDANSR